MQVTEKNCRVIDKIIETLASEKCTVWEAQDILTETARIIRQTSIVQMGEKLTEKYHRITDGEFVEEWCQAYSEHFEKENRRE